MNKYILLIICFAMVLSKQVKGNGIAYQNSEDKIYLDILSSDIDVTINDQVSVTTILHDFHNQYSDTLFVRYAFPLPETASATKLRYYLNDKWHEASIAAEPQDSIDVGGCNPQGNYELREYLGETPLIYDVELGILPGDTIRIELSYVELLPYKLGIVNYQMPFSIADFLSNEVLDCKFRLTLFSQRQIDAINLNYPYTGDITETNYGDSAIIDVTVNSFSPGDDISVSYKLSSDELGLFCLSTFIPDSLVPDELGNGFFTFIVEPEHQPANQIISKNFTLIIDRSGSMSGNKIIDARDAATFIVENLNENDKFNIVSFSSDITSFRGEHVNNTLSNRNQAISYIQSLNADGSTNISGAFATAVPQFSAAEENTANIIIFLTDGEQTSGITNTANLIDYINDLVISSETNINLFSFGIGNSTNEQLLRTISYENKGLSEFLADNELESVITEFFLLINNPVLLETSIEFSQGIISEIYPLELPNLYLGQQMILSGRYSESIETEAILTGTAFGQPVEYNYNPDLASEYNGDYLFLMKIWAKQKIETLLNEYYTNLNDTSISNPLRREIIRISLDYYVISPFTSYQGSEEDNYPSVNSLEEFSDQSIEENSNEYISNLKVLGGNNYGTTYINFSYNYPDLKHGRLVIASLSGQLIDVRYVQINHGENLMDITELVRSLPKGIYTLTLKIESADLSVLLSVR